jgi:hypothetical protein
MVKSVQVIMLDEQGNAVAKGKGIKDKVVLEARGLPGNRVRADE